MVEKIAKEISENVTEDTVNKAEQSALKDVLDNAFKTNAFYENANCKKLLAAIKEDTKKEIFYCNDAINMFIDDYFLNEQDKWDTLTTDEVIKIWRLYFSGYYYGATRQRQLDSELLHSPILGKSGKDYEE